MLLSFEQLEKHGACIEQLYKFKAFFGMYTDVTVESCINVAHEFNWFWAGSFLLKSKKAKKLFLTAEAKITNDYLNARIKAQNDYVNRLYEIKDVEHYVVESDKIKKICSNAIIEAYKSSSVEYAEAFAVAYNLKGK